MLKKVFFDNLTLYHRDLIMLFVDGAKTRGKLSSGEIVFFENVTDHSVKNSNHQEITHIFRADILRNGIMPQNVEIELHSLGGHLFSGHISLFLETEA